MRNKEVLHRAMEEKNSWIGHILRRYSFIQSITEGNIEGRIEVAERRGRRRKQLLYDLREKTGSVNWKRKY